jgi:hypothetical protein
VFLAAVRRRRLGFLVAEHAALALTLAMAVFVVLLILGTQILDWYWPVATLAVSLLWSALRLRKRIPAPYEQLQATDGHLHLHDALSTAFHFDRIAPRDADAAQVRDAQRRHAEALALAADPAAAVPWSTPRSVYLAVGVAVVAASLFGLRFGTLKTLDLRLPVAPALAEFFHPSEEMVEAWNRPPEPEPEVPPEALAVTLPEHEEDDPESMTEVRLTPEESAALADGQTSGANRPAGEEGARDHDSAADGSPSSDSAPDQPPSNPSGDPGPMDDANPKPPSFDQDSDLLRKMQDAFANLMNKVNVPPRAGERRRSALSKSEAAEGQERRSTAAQANSEEQKGNGPSPTSQNAQQMAGQTQPAAGQGQEHRAQAGEASQKNSGSGSGQSEGDKGLREAAQLEAMGRLEEIVGNRARNLKGEIMVEVSSGPQRLTTSYSETEATHRAAGGEIHRDEVPLSLQPYIQRYFEEVRKGEQPTAR